MPRLFKYADKMRDSTLTEPDNPPTHCTYTEVNKEASAQTKKDILINIV